MTEQFLTFQSFTDLDLAKEIANRLMGASIPTQVEDTSPPIPPVIMGTSLTPDIRIKIRRINYFKRYGQASCRDSNTPTAQMRGRCTLCEPVSEPCNFSPRLIVLKGSNRRSKLHKTLL